MKYIKMIFLSVIVSGYLEKVYLHSGHLRFGKFDGILKNLEQKMFWHFLLNFSCFSLSDNRSDFFIDFFNIY